MALITCVDCGSQISPRATACPKCGGPTNTVSNQSPTPAIVPRREPSEWVQMLVQDQRKASRTNFAVVVIVLLLVAGTVGAALLASGVIKGRNGLPLESDQALFLATPLVIFFCGSALALFIYFTPSIVAHQNKHPRRTAIRVLNLLLGWTFIGWVVALVWAYSVPESQIKRS